MKKFAERPNYVQLLEHPFIHMYEDKSVDVASFVEEAMQNETVTPS